MRLWIPFAGIVCSASLALAQTVLLPFTGRLESRDGTPVERDVQLTFRLYSQAGGGTALWTEIVPASIKNGAFSVLLGRDPPLPPTAFEGGGTRFLGIELDGVEFSPRLTLTTAPSAAYALNTQDAQSLEGHTPDDFAPTRHDHGARYIGRAEAGGRWATAEHAHPGQYASTTHLHDGLYAKTDHAHDGLYSPASHDHDLAYAARDHAHPENAPASHNHASLYYTRTESQGLFAPANHEHDAAHFTKSAADARFVTTAGADVRWTTRAEADQQRERRENVFTKEEADARFITAATADFLTHAAADARYAAKSGVAGDFSVGGNLTLSDEGLTYPDGTRVDAAAVKALSSGTADGLHWHSYNADAWCDGLVIAGICVADWRALNDRNFVAAAQACTHKGADIATDSQMMMLRYSGWLSDHGTFWSSSFADDDGDYVDHAFNGMPDDHNQANNFSYACVRNVTPDEVKSELVGGVRLTYVHNLEDSSFDLAARVCAAKQSDLCSDSEYGILREAGKVSVRVWSNSHSDADSEGRWVPFTGGVPDTPHHSWRYGYACCASRRPLDLSCPGELVAGLDDVAGSGVCVVKQEVDAIKPLLAAAKDCAAEGARLCTVSQTAVLRAAGVFTPTANWTASHSDNDGGGAANCATKNGPNMGVGCSMPDDPDPNQPYAYACCL